MELAFLRVSSATERSIPIAMRTRSILEVVIVSPFTKYSDLFKPRNLLEDFCLEK